VHGVHRHVLANGSASFQSHPNHANTVRPNPADRAIPPTKDLRAETGSFGAFKPNTFTCARLFFLSRARERVWKGISHSRLMAFARMIGREGLSRFTSWISGCQKRASTLWYRHCALVKQGAALCSPRHILQLIGQSVPKRQRPERSWRSIVVLGHIWHNETQKDVARLKSRSS